MSCPNSNAPIDISIKNISGKCDLKCAYSFKYPNSSCTATNRGEYISIAYDSSSNAPVTYNGVGYNVNEIRIYSPSLHTFNGTHAAAELMIIHASNKGTKPLLVCVPFMEGNTSTKGSSILTSVVNGMSSNAPSEGETASVYIDDFTMDAFVPKKPYFSYTAIQPYQPCVGDVDLIVFTPVMSSGYIASGTLHKLNTIISNNSYTIKTGPLLFFNEKGPGTSGLGGEIYIDCKPIDKSSEETLITQEVPNSSSNISVNIDVNTILENPLFQIIISSLLFVGIILIFTIIVKALSNRGKINISNVIKQSN